LTKSTTFYRRIRQTPISSIPIIKNRTKDDTKYFPPVFPVLHHRAGTIFSHLWLERHQRGSDHDQPDDLEDLPPPDELYGGNLWQPDGRGQQGHRGDGSEGGQQLPDEISVDIFRYKRQKLAR
jgi:hypothetical protein